MIREWGTVIRGYGDIMRGFGEGVFMRGCGGVVRCDGLIWRGGLCGQRVYWFGEGGLYDED